MGRLIYSAICSLDGYVTDRDGNFDWAEPDAEVHAFVNDLARPWSTSASCSCARSWSAVGSRCGRRVCGPGSSWSRTRRFDSGVVFVRHRVEN